MSWKRKFAQLRRNQSGVAGIEMAIIVPVLMILFLGMIDITALLSDSRRLSYSSNVVASLVTQLESPATPAQIADTFKAVEMVMELAQTQDVRVEVYNFRKDTSTVPPTVKRH